MLNKRYLFVVLLFLVSSLAFAQITTLKVFKDSLLKSNTDTILLLASGAGGYYDRLLIYWQNDGVCNIQEFDNKEEIKGKGLVSKSLNNEIVFFLKERLFDSKNETDANNGVTHGKEYILNIIIKGKVHLFNLSEAYRLSAGDTKESIWLNRVLNKLQFNTP